MAGHVHVPAPHDEVQDPTHGWVFFENLFDEPVIMPLPSFELFGHEFHITKFMILQVVAALLVILIYVPLARRIKAGGLPTGRWWNMFESLLTFIRDQVARPNLDSHHDVAPGHDHSHGHATTMSGEMPLSPDEEAHVTHHEADKYVPFLWTLFLYVLFCNVLGMIPFLGSPTASIWVTAGLALIAFVMMHGAPIVKVGPVNYFKSLWPKIDMPPGAVFKVMGYVFTLGIGLIEIMGTFIKSGVLAVRLFANMFAGHLVLANIMLFIILVGNAFGTGALWGGVTLASILGVIALSLLELFVAFLQAYIFTFLTALFMGMSLHHAEPH
jgi:F-type H+-transporting ATPase subunit a